jgi:hypothetical protein
LPCLLSFSVSFLFKTSAKNDSMTSHREAITVKTYAPLTSGRIRTLTLLHVYEAISEICNSDITRFLEQDSYQMCFVFCSAGDDQQTEQSNYLAEGQNPM